MAATSGRAALISACLMATLVPALPFMSWPEWRSQPEAPAVVHTVPPPPPQRVAAWPPAPAPKPAIVKPQAAPNPPAALTESEPEPTTPQTPTEAVASVLVAAMAMDWRAVDARLARMKARVPSFTSQEVDALNAKARNDLQRDDKDSAAEALTQVLAMKPDWPTAWSNLTEALTNPQAARSALRVAIHLSTHRVKTIEYLRKVEREMAGEPFGRLAAQALKEIDQIPLHPKDTSLRAAGP
jgi:hypothetical protein